VLDVEPDCDAARRELARVEAFAKTSAIAAS